MSTSVEQAAARSIGTVESVAPDEVRVLLNLDAPQAVALNAGQLQRFPRINSFVLIPNEVGALVGIVAWLGIERSSYPKRPGLRDFGLVDLPFPLRKMSLVPLGTLLASGREGFELRRGVMAYPSVGDPVVLPTSSQQRALVEGREADLRVRIGTSPLISDVAVTVDPDKLFGRHLAVLGNTGSGKSCSVAGVIRWSLDAAKKQRANAQRAGNPNARFIVLDPNGEYRRTFADLGARLFRVDVPEDDEAKPLRVPAWLWNGHEWAAFAQAAPGTQRPMLSQALRDLRAGGTAETGPKFRLAVQVRGYRTRIQSLLGQGVHGYSGEFKAIMNCARALKGIAEAIEPYHERVPEAADEIQGLVGAAQDVLASREWRSGTRSGYNDFVEPDLERVRDAADALIAQLPVVEMNDRASEDAPIAFPPGDMIAQLEHLAVSEDFAGASAFLATLLLRVRSMLADTRLTPIVAPETELSLEQWLENHLGTEDGADGQVAVLDLSMVPTDVLHLVIAVVARVVFESLQRYRKLHGHELPTVIVLEEAHTFVQRTLGEDPTYAMPARMCRETFEKIAREGRKFGLGLLLSSQRPSELSQTVLAQCNTFLLHRLVNDRDQDLVGRLVPDNLGGLLRELPSLPSQQAILLGWAAPLPTLVRIEDLPPEQRPHSEDPSFWNVWTGEASRSIDWGTVARDWTD